MRCSHTSGMACASLRTELVVARREVVALTAQLSKAEAASSAAAAAANFNRDRVAEMRAELEQLHAAAAAAGNGNGGGARVPPLAAAAARGDAPQAIARADGADKPRDSASVAQHGRRPSTPPRDEDAVGLGSSAARVAELEAALSRSRELLTAALQQIDRVTQA